MCGIAYGTDVIALIDRREGAPFRVFIMAMKKRVVGVCFSGSGEEYQTKIIEVLMEYARGYDISLMFYASLDNKYNHNLHDLGEYSVYKLINFDKLDGLVMISESIKDNAVLDDIVSRAKSAGVPVVCFDKPIDNADCNIVFDDCGAIESITEHLIKVHGCRRINFLAGYFGQYVSDRRLESYKCALDKNGIPFDPERTAEGKWWAGGAKSAVDKWLEEGMTFDAVVCANDNMAMAAADELAIHGISVPEVVKVTGIDDLRAAECYIPRITTARFKHSEGICKAIDVLRDIWAGRSAEKRIVFGNDLVFAESCGCVTNGLDKIKINSYAYELSYKNEITNIFDKHLIRFTNNVDSAGSFEKSLDIMANYLERAWCRELWVCINDGFFEGDDHGAEYAETMHLMLHRGAFGCEKSDIIFSASELIPDFENKIAENTNLLVMPLHVKETTVGYVVREFMSTQALDQWYMFSMNLSGMFDVIRGQEQLRKANAMLENMYVHDSMTGLYNRRGFFKAISEKFGGSPSCELMVVSADLDGLKEINDKYGHTEGDNAIETVASALEYACGDRAVCARFGGDEFIAAGLYEAGLAEDFEEKFDSFINDFNASSDVQYKVGASIGIVADRCTIENIDRIISIADERMYMQKNERKQFVRQSPR